MVAWPTPRRSSVGHGRHIGNNLARWRQRLSLSGSGRRCCAGACVCFSIATIRVEQAAPARWKLAAACTGLLATLLLSMVTLRPSVATAHEMKEAQQVTRNQAPDDSRKATSTEDRLEYSGRVLDPDGKPFAGAKLHLAYFGYTGQAPPAIRATSDSQGHFRIDVRKQDFVDTDNETPWSTALVVGTADGFWTRLG